MSEDYYELLGVDRDAGTAAIERAFRNRVADVHPDVSDDPDAEKAFKRIKRAKEVLTDEELRRDYDRLGHRRFVRRETMGDDDREWQQAQSATNASGTPGASDGQTHESDGPGGAGSHYDRRFGPREDPLGAKHRGPSPRQGEDRKASVEVDLAEAYHGTRERVSVTRAEPCPGCDGRGFDPASGPQPCSNCGGRGRLLHLIDTGRGRTRRTEACDRCGGTGEVPGEPCTRCDGDGRIPREVSLRIDIPPGVESGQQLRIDREGDLGAHGGSRGDFLADITVTDHSRFAREDDDLYTGLPVSFPQATFGATVQVPTLDRSVAMRIPAGTQSGETFRLREKGMPAFEAPGYGDLYVRVEVITPDELTDDQRAALQDFMEADTAGDDGPATTGVG